MSVITLNEARAFLQVASTQEDDLIALLARGAVEWVAAQCGAVIGEQTRIEDLDGGGRLIELPGRPALSVERVFDRTAGVVIEPARYQLRRDGLLLGGDARWPDGVARFRVAYRCGYADPEEPGVAGDATTTGGVEPARRVLPDALKAAALHLLRRAYDNRAGAARENLAGWAVEWDALADGQVAALLEPWREMGV